MTHTDAIKPTFIRIFRLLLALLILGACLGPRPARAATINKCGYIDEDETWTSGNVYVLTCEFYVTYNTTLTIQAGTVIKANGRGLHVAGALDLQGTAENPVVFTSYYDDEYGGDTDGTSTPPAPSQWGGVHLDSSTTFDHALVRYAGAGVSVDNDSSQPLSPTISDSTFTFNHKAVLLMARYGPVNATLRDNTFVHNEYGVYAGANHCSAPVITGNTFSNITQYPLALQSNMFPSYANNTFVGNAHPAISLGGDFYCSGVLPVVSGLPYVLVGSLGPHLAIATGQTLTLPAGAIIKSSPTTYLSVYGMLDLQGTVENPVVFTSYSDDEYGGDTDGTSTLPAPGQWEGIRLFDIASTFDYAMVRYANVGLSLYGPAPVAHSTFEYNRTGLFLQTYTGETPLYIQNNTFRYNTSGIGLQLGTGLLPIHIQDNTLRRNEYGIKLSNVGYPSPALIRNNNFLLNTLYGAYKNGSPTIAIENNWWGHPSGPYHSSNRSGQGDPVSSYLDFNPWLTSGPPPVDQDLTIASVAPVQVIEDVDLVKDKPAAVKVDVCKTGPAPLSDVQAEVALDSNGYSSVFSNFWVSEPENINQATGELIDANDDHPLDFPAGEACKTIYYFGSGLTPTGETYQVQARVDPENAVIETDEDNNSAESAEREVAETRWSGVLTPELKIYYVPADWNNSTDVFNAYVQASSALLKGVMPVAPDRFKPGKSDWYRGYSIFYSGFDDKLSNLELNVWRLNTEMDLRLAHPTVDRFIAVLPGGWFANMMSEPGWEGVKGVTNENQRRLVHVEAASSTRPNGYGPNPSVHEIGHSFYLPAELPNGCKEEYKECNNPNPVDGIGNRAAPGMWVERKIPIDDTAYCSMGLVADVSYWIDRSDYLKLYTDHGGESSRRAAAASEPVILAAGFAGADGSAVLTDWYVLPEGELDTLTPGPYAFEYRAGDGSLLDSLPFDLSFDLEGIALEQTPFVFTIPYIPSTAQIVITHNGVPMAIKTVSANPPQVTLAAPADSGPFSGPVAIQWSGADADNDALSYTLLYSSNGGLSWEPVAGGLEATAYTWDTTGLPDGEQYVIKIIATDGFNTGEEQSTLFSLSQDESIYLPLVVKR